MTTMRYLLSITILLVAACAASNDRPPPVVNVSVESKPRGVQQFREQRAQIDRAGATADCRVLPNEPTESSWLRAWCAHRTADWSGAVRAGRRAAEFFTETAQWRRATEMWLIMAHAAAWLDDLDTARDAIARAEELIEWTRMSTRGGLRDPYAGDLAYLEATVQVLGLWVARPEPLSREALLDVAIAEMRSVGQREARGNALREMALAQLDAGRVDRSLAALSASISLARKTRNPVAMEASILFTAEVAERLGAPEVKVWNGGADIDLGEEVLPGEPNFSNAIRLRATDAGRRELAQMLRAYRRSPEARLRPDSRLVDLLLDPETLRYTEGRNWDFALHAGLMLREMGETERSRRFIESSVETIELTRHSIADAALRQRFFRGKRSAYLALVQHYVGVDTSQRPQADVALGLGVANATKARGLLDLFSGAIEPSQTLATTTRWENATSPRARAEVLQAHLREWIGRPSRPDSTRLRPFDHLGRIELGAGTRLLEYVIGEQAGFVFVIGGERLAVRQIPGRRELTSRVVAFSKALTDRSDDPRPVAERLYVDLIAPVQDLIRDADTLIIAPDETIADVPFAALARPQPGPDPEWLIAHHAIGYVPSTAVARHLSERGSISGRGSLLLGDPDLDRNALSLAPLVENPQSIVFEQLTERFAPLPGARAEVRAVARAVPGAAVLRRSKATERRIVGTSDAPVDILHVAAHGIADGDAGSLAVHQPAILLARGEGSPHDGVLTLEEIITYKPQARLVTLSGCRTGVGWQALGDGAFGLAGAFLFAGSDVVVASGWPVEDNATRDLMGAFYRNLKRGEAEALRRAQLEQSKRLGPFYWASFRAFGSTAGTETP